MAGLRRFRYSELETATNNCNTHKFSTYPDETIYKGWVDEVTYAPTEPGVGLAMYVRTRHIGDYKVLIDPEGFNHPNLVKFLGYCMDGLNLSCVYELIPGASLDELLFGDPGTTSLSWFARLKIALGAAQGLSFLHKNGHPAYNQFRTTCILVDTNHKARLQDFEVEDSFVALRSYSFEKDAHYAAPEWFRYQADVKLEDTKVAHELEDDFGVKSEVYSFGIVLLEMLTGMKVFDLKRREEKHNLVKWATPLLPHEDNLGRIMDPKLQDDNQIPKGGFMLAQLISICLQPTPDERPSMEEVVQVLRECILEQFDERILEQFEYENETK